MSRINDKLGLKAAGRRALLDALSGVKCPNCPHRDCTSNRVSGRLVWMCGWCGCIWSPTSLELEAYNLRVRPRDRIEA